MASFRPARGRLWWCTTALLAWHLNGAVPEVTVSPEGGVVVSILDARDLEVAPLFGGKPGPALMGRTERQKEQWVFVPVVPLLPGQHYRARWQSSRGQESLDFTNKAEAHVPPQVKLAPEAPLPANALKFYLHFSEPMEQGVFLDRLHLLDARGQEVIGPFRETELWSPDGKRLTVWFHPGRQKAGVNLNVDEGPVLHPKAHYTLIVSGAWRSTAGVPIGEDRRLEFATLDADHDCPQMMKWDLSAPKEGTRDPLKLRFEEGLDPAMLKTALHVRVPGSATDLLGKVELNPAATTWTFVPAEAWAKGEHELASDPDLEDFAGNSLIKPFEVDLSAPSSREGVTARRFTVK